MVAARIIRAVAGKRKWGPIKGFVTVSKVEPCLTCSELLVSCNSLVFFFFFFFPFPFSIQADQGDEVKPSKVTYAYTARRAGQSMSQARPPVL